MAFTVANVDEIVATLSVNELRNQTNVTQIIAALGNDKDLLIHFLVSKNIKVFGGINPYVHDYLEKLNVDRLTPEQKETARFTLEKMLTYKELSDDNKVRIRDLNEKLHNAAAKGAGKSRKKRKLRRKSKKYAY
jgi:hypothetical protein